MNGAGGGPGGSGGEPSRPPTGLRPSWAGYICHGSPGRCLTYKGRPMAICARCFGFYTGLLAGLPFGIVLTFLPHLTLWPMVMLLEIGVGPFFIDGVTQYFGWRGTKNGIRLATGLLAGTASMGVIVELVLYSVGL